MKCPVCGNDIRNAVPVCPNCSYILGPSDSPDSLHQPLSFDDGTRGKQKNEEENAGKACLTFILGFIALFLFAVLCCAAFQAHFQTAYK